MTTLNHDQLALEVKALWESGGLRKGSFPGWPSLGKHYSIGMAQWTVITGTPGSGKSEFMDALMVNLAKRETWKFCIYSPENHPVSTHIAKLLEKYLRKPFNPGPTERMDAEQVADALEWMAGKFHFIDPKEPSLAAVLDDANVHAGWPGVKLGVVIDPWNQIEHNRLGLSETDYISYCLSMVTQWARARECHVWIVAHPQKMLRGKDGKYPVPTLYDISGSAHWFNKADNGICVWRDRTLEYDDPRASEVDIHIQKIRFKHIGYEGMVTLQYNRITGEYLEREPSMVPAKWGEKHA